LKKTDPARWVSARTAISMLCMATAGAAEHGARPIPIVTATKTMTMAGMRYVMDRFASCVGFTPSFSGDSLQPAGLRHGKRCVLQESIGLFLLICQGNSYRRAAGGAALGMAVADPEAILAQALGEDHRLATSCHVRVGKDCSSESRDRRTT
jgi:hypothetical protein